MTEIKRAIIYTRVSRDDSGEGKSNQRQEEDCRKLADLRGWEIVGVEADISISAYGRKKRPGWQRVLDAIEGGEVEVVIAWHIDRMTRSMLDLEQLILLAEEKGVGIATVSGDIDLTTDVGRMVARILAAVARAEVERKGARQRRANQQRAAEGIPRQSGWRALGYELDGTLIDKEAALIQQAAEDVLAGVSLREVARQWRDMGVSTPRSKNWTHSGVRSVLVNPRYAGIATYKGEEIGRGSWEAILPYETHLLLVAKLTDGSRIKGRKIKGRGPENLLTGVARCAICEEPVEAGSGYKGKLIYQCKSYHISTPRREADEIVRSAFAMAIASVRPGGVMPIPTGGAPTELWKEAEALRDRLNELSVLYAKGSINAQQFEAASISIQSDLEAVEQRITEDANNSGDPVALRAEQVRDFLDLDMNGQRKVLTQMATITLHPKGRGKRNVPIKHQVTMTVRLGEREIPALNERPRP